MVLTDVASIAAGQFMRCLGGGQCRLLSRSFGAVRLRNTEWSWSNDEGVSGQASEECCNLRRHYRAFRSEEAARKQKGSRKDDSGAFFTRRELQLGEENRVVRMTIGRSECE